MKKYVTIGLALLLLSALFVGCAPAEEEVNPNGYTLVIGVDGILDVEVDTPTQSGGVRHADNTPFRRGELVWLEQLDELSSLRGVSVKALDEEGRVVYHFSVAEDATREEIQELLVGSWLIPPAEKV